MKKYDFHTFCMQRCVGERFKKINIVEIVSIDKKVLSDIPSSEGNLSCKVKEVDSNGSQTISTYRIYFSRLIGSERWVVYGYKKQ